MSTAFYLVLLILALLLILAIDVPRLVKKALWRELTVMLIFWSVASYVSIAIVLRINLPNPFNFLMEFSDLFNYLQ